MRTQCFEFYLTHQIKFCLPVLLFRGGKKRDSGGDCMSEQAALIDPDQSVPSGAGLVTAGGPRLLVIDDDHLHRMIICRAAAKAGYVPAGAAGYEEASKLLQENVFDCITLDLSLGDHAGVELLRLLWV